MSPVLSRSAPLPANPAEEERWLRFRDYRFPLFLVLVLSFALLQGGKIPYLLLYFLLSLEVLSLIWIRGILRGLTGAVETSRRTLTARQTLKIKLRLYNEGFWPVPWVKTTMVPEIIAGSQAFPRGFPGVFSLGPLTSRVAVIETPPLRRGLYPLGPFQVALGDPWGLYRGYLTLRGAQEVVVFPRVLSPAYLPLENGRPFGRQRRNGLAWEDPSSLRDLHPFHPGDNPKRVHWPTSARLGQLYVREFDLTSSPSLMILLDLYAGSYSDQSLPSAETRPGSGQDGRGNGPNSVSLLEDIAVEVAVAIAQYALLNRQDFGFFAAGNTTYRLPVDKASRNFPLLLRSMVEAHPQGVTPLARILTQEKGLLQRQQTLAIVTPRLDHDLSLLLPTLSRRGLGGAVFLIQEEKVGETAPAGPVARSGEAGGGTASSALGRGGFPVLVLQQAEDLLEVGPVGRSSPRGVST